jgi:hypothetical protein
VSLVETWAQQNKKKEGMCLVLKGISIRDIRRSLTCEQRGVYGEVV